MHSFDLVGWKIHYRPASLLHTIRALAHLLASCYEHEIKMLFDLPWLLKLDLHMVPFVSGGGDPTASYTGHSRFLNEV